MEVTVTTIQFKVKNKPGKVNAADYRHLPRHPTQSKSVTSKHSQLAEEFVRYLTDNVVPKAMTLNEIVNCTQKDSDLQTLSPPSKQTNGTNRMKIVY
jgi:hypothetical protein